MKCKGFFKASGIVAIVTIFILATTGLAVAKDENTLFIGTVLDFASYSAPFDVPADEGVRLAVDEINAAANKRGTILLLDSLDEDPEAYGRVKDRLLEILHASQHFFRVIITCRTQFFPDVDKDRLDRLGWFATGGFTCLVKYLS